MANIGDARDRMGMVDSGIHALWKGAKAVGRARTVWVREGDNKAIHDVVTTSGPVTSSSSTGRATPTAP